MNKAFLSWDEEDYKRMGLEAPDCVKCGQTEGEAMEEEDVTDWATETVQTLSVLREHYPNRFKEQFENFVADLEYLCKLGKITQEEKEKLEKPENFSFGTE